VGLVEDEDDSSPSLGHLAGKQARHLGDQRRLVETWHVTEATDYLAIEGLRY